MRYATKPLLCLVSLLGITNGLVARTSTCLEPSSQAVDWDSGICKSLGVIFARGTFDSGNIGTWVGPQFLKPLQDAGAAVQGVHEKTYPATLQSYLAIGTDVVGNAGPKELAAQVTKYLDKCVGSKVVISGWSQGALVARQGYHLLDARHRKGIKAMVTFGDPITRFQNLDQTLDIPLVPHEIGCNTDNDAADPLCISIAEVKTLVASTTAGSFTLSNILGPWLKIPSLGTSIQQTISLLKLTVKFLPQFKQALPQFLSDLTSFEKAARLLLWPSHFFYGNNGHSAKAAAWVLQL